MLTPRSSCPLQDGRGTGRPLHLRRQSRRVSGAKDAAGTLRREVVGVWLSLSCCPVGISSRPAVRYRCPLQHPAWGVLSQNQGSHPSVSSGASSEAITCTYSCLLAAGKALCSAVTLLCSPLVLSLLCHASVWQPLLPVFIRINLFVLNHQNQKVVQTSK